MGGISYVHPLRNQAFGSLLGSLQIEIRPSAELLQQEHKLAALFTVGGRFDLSRLIKDLEKQIKSAAQDLEFEKAAALRNEQTRYVRNAR